MTIKELNRLIAHFSYAGDKEKVEKLEQRKKEMYNDKAEQAKARNREFKYDRTDFNALGQMVEGKYLISARYLNIYLKMATDKGDTERVDLIKAEQKRRTKQARQEYKYNKFSAQANELFAQLFND